MVSRRVRAYPQYILVCVHRGCGATHAGMQPVGLWTEGQRRTGEKYRQIMDDLTAQMNTLDKIVAGAVDGTSLPADQQGAVSPLDATLRLIDAQRPLSSAASGPAAAAGGMNAQPAATPNPCARTIGGPEWGATEGGRDKLGWVRQLVRYTETHPIFVPAPDSSAAASSHAAAEAADEADGGTAAVRTTVRKLQRLPSSVAAGTSDEIISSTV